MSSGEGAGPVASFRGLRVAGEGRTRDAIVVGSGAAGWNCAARLRREGLEDVLLVCESVRYGTSRNTGSDDQTYCKVSTSGAAGDSARELAITLHSGGAMDGDTALAEAAGSLAAFHHLSELGVEFPLNAWGEAVGYTTDHDSRARASSVGPYTSRRMTEVLEAEARALGVEVREGLRVIQALPDRDGTGCGGLLALESPGGGGLTLLHARHYVFATGGPAEFWDLSVYPESQQSASGVLARTGLPFANMQEWQWGLGSTLFRWNLSGSYQQVLPRYVSVDAAGGEHDFLAEVFPSMAALLEATFLKGYQWPFDPRRIPGSSLVDLAVYRQTRILGRKVFLDFRNNPRHPSGPFHPDALPLVVRDYLERSGALGDSPLDRLTALNAPARELYLDHGIDLGRELLEIDVLAQHHNGGLEVDAWWRSAWKNLWAAGECAGTHGVYRPGGAALNSGQVAGRRIARRIRQLDREGNNPATPPDVPWIRQCLEAFSARLDALAAGENPVVRRDRLRTLHGRHLGCVRIREGLAELEAEGRGIPGAPGGPAEAPALEDLCALDGLLALSAVFLASVHAHRDAGRGSRGSALYPRDSLPDDGGWQDGGFFALDGVTDAPVTLAHVHAGPAGTSGPWPECGRVLRPPRALPEGGGWFEAVWKDWRREREGGCGNGEA